MAITGAQYEFNEVASEETFMDSGGKASFNYIVYSNDPNDGESLVRDHLQNNTTTTYFNLFRSRIAVKERVKGNNGESIWKATVEYSNPKSADQEKPRPGEEGPSYTVLEVRSGGGESLQATESKEFIEEQLDPVIGTSYGLSGSKSEKTLNLKAAAPEAEALLNAEGIPVEIGTVEVVAHAWKSNATWNGGYSLQVAGAAARNIVNSTAWKGFAAKTLKFVSFQATQQAGNDAGWQLTYSFEFKPITPKEDLVIGFVPEFTADVPGHYYVDILYVPDDPDPFNPTVVLNSVPARAAVHRIFDEEDYASVLGI